MRSKGGSAPRDRSPAVTPFGDPLLGSAFHVPPPPSRLVVRGRLLDRLSLGRPCSLTLLSAPAGSGKTVLAASWAASRTASAAGAGDGGGATTWVDVGDTGEAPGVFWAYVLEGLRRSGVVLEGVAPPARPEAVDRPFLIRLASALFERSNPVVLVLDDADCLASRDIADGVDFVLRHAAPQLRLVVTTRIDPMVPLHRYRLAGDVTEIRAEELAFTVPEAQLLLADLGTELSTDVVSVLTAHTEGWAAGLRLAGMTVRDRPEPDQLVGSLARNEGQIAEYFVQEVLDREPPEVRDFLARTSVADTLWPELTNSLLGRHDGRETLAALCNANLFIQPQAGTPGCYRYHRLFREHLRARLAYFTPEEVPELHRRTARWLADHGDVTSALHHYVLAGDWQAAAGLLIDGLAVGRLLSGCGATARTDAFLGMPADAPGPEPALVRAALAVAEGDDRTCERQLALSGELADAALVDDVGVQLSTAMLRLALARRRGDVDTVLCAAEEASTLIDRLPAGQQRAHTELRCLVLSSRGDAQSWAGTLGAAADSFALGLRLAETAGCQEARLDCLGRGALLDAVGGRLHQAGKSGRAAEDLADERGLPTHSRPAAAAVTLAWVSIQHYDLPGARQWIKLVDTRPVPDSDRVVAAAARLVRARFLRARGDLTSALSALAQAGDARQDAGQGEPSWLEQIIDSERAALRLAQGRPTVAADLVATMRFPRPPQADLVLAEALLAGGDVSGAGRAGADLLERPDLPLDARVGGLLLAAGCWLDRGEAVRARSVLDDALRLAEPECLRRPFLEAAPTVRRLLRHEDTGSAARLRWLDPSAGARAASRASVVRPPVTAVGPLVVEPLTEKEQEVLEHLAALLSTEEIAAAMFVSVNTVKTHVRSILRKLAAPRRNDAIRRAHEMQLI